MGLFSAALSVLRKDILLEFRTRYGINTVLLFVIISVSLVLFSFAGETLENTLVATLMWNTIFFSAITSLQRGFVSEEEQNTILFLKLSAEPTAIFLGKLFYNIILALSINVLVAVLYLATLELGVTSWAIFLLTLVLGSLSMAITLTLISAIVANTSSRSGLFAVLSFPPILPPVWLVVRATRLSTAQPLTAETGFTELQLLTAYSVVMLTLSLMLFDFVWED
ncbi:MAG: ABC transporter permease [Chlorobiales bacterium]|jgi:heme exporter protein B|nr:ABC transporter permease [Chlorobiales bacterium]